MDRPCTQAHVQGHTPWFVLVAYPVDRPCMLGHSLCGYMPTTRQILHISPQHQFDPLISIIAFSFSFIFFIIIISINYLYCGSSRGLILTFAWLMAASFVKFNCCGLYQLSLSSRIQQLDSRNRKKDLFVLKLNIFNPFLPLQKKKKEKKSQILVI